MNIILEIDKRRADKELAVFIEHHKRAAPGSFLDPKQVIKGAVAYGLGLLALDILAAATLGATRYHKLHGQYPSNPGAFVDSCLSHGIRAACALRH